MIGKLTHAWRVWRSEKREQEKMLGRSGKWAGVRDGYLKTHPACAACGSGEKLQVHHVKPYHLHPELELDAANLIGLCMSIEECHLTIGHGGNFDCFNPYVVRDAKRYQAARAMQRAAIKVQVKRYRLKDEATKAA